MESIRVICRKAAEEAAGSLKKEVGEICRQKGREVLWMDCNSARDVEYAASGHRDAAVLLQERDYREERCCAWEIAAVRDAGNVRVVPCVKRIHYGTSFMAVLYAGGIVDALYEDEADAGHIAERLLTARNRKECREYYGIRSLKEVVSVLQIMEQDTLERYIRFIGGGADRDGMLDRLDEVSKKLNFTEQCFLVERLPENVREEIGDGAGLEKFHFSPPVNVKRKKSYLARK